IPDERREQPQVRGPDYLELRQVPGQPQGRGGRSLRARRKPLVREGDRRNREGAGREVIAIRRLEFSSTGRAPFVVLVAMRPAVSGSSPRLCRSIWRDGTTWGRNHAAAKSPLAEPPSVAA